MILNQFFLQLFCVLKDARQCFETIFEQNNFVKKIVDYFNEFSNFFPSNNIFRKHQLAWFSIQTHHKGLVDIGGASPQHQALHKKFEKYFFHVFSEFFFRYAETEDMLKISYHIALGRYRRPKGAFWAPKNSKRLKRPFWMPIVPKRDMMCNEIFSASLVSAHCASVMSRWSFRRGGGEGVCISLICKEPFFLYLKQKSAFA